MEARLPNHGRLCRLVGFVLKGLLFLVALSVAFVAVFVYRLCTLVHLQLAPSIYLFYLPVKRRKIVSLIYECSCRFGCCRYRPSEETLQQIDRFCISTIADCDISPNRRSSPWSRSLSQQSGASTSSTTISPSLPVSTFASGTLVKSLNYIRSLVARHIPKRSFQPAAFAGAASASRQSLPSLSSLLSRSFNSQLNPTNSGESSENNDASTLSVSNFSNVEKVDGGEDVEYIALDVLQWRWPGEQQSSMVSSDRLLVFCIYLLASFWVVMTLLFEI